MNTIRWGLERHVQHAVLCLCMVHNIPGGLETRSSRKICKLRPYERQSEIDGHSSLTQAICYMIVSGNTFSSESAFVLEAVLQNRLLGAAALRLFCLQNDPHRDVRCFGMAMLPSTSKMKASVCRDRTRVVLVKNFMLLVQLQLVFSSPELILVYSSGIQIPESFGLVIIVTIMVVNSTKLTTGWGCDHWDEGMEQHLGSFQIPLTCVAARILVRTYQDTCTYIEA